MRLKIFSLLIVALLPLNVSAAERKTAPREEPAYSIAAVVNDDIISTLDVDKRMRFILATTGLNDTPDVRQKLKQQVIRSLIDEKLQMQEAAANGITVAPEDIGGAIAGLERQRGRPPGSLEAFLAEKKVDTGTFQQQLRAQVGWNKLVLKKLRPQVKVSDEEIRLARKRIASEGAAREVQIATIALPIDKPEQESEVRKLAEKLTGEIKGGASFEAVANQFSSGQGTEAFWISPGQLDPALAQVLAKEKPGSIVGPVRTATGYTLVKFINTRASSAATFSESDEEVTFRDVLIALNPGASSQETEASRQIAEMIAQNPGTCTEEGIANLSEQELSGYGIAVAQRTERMNDLPPPMQEIAGSLKPGEISKPVGTDEGIRLFLLCDRKEIGASDVDKERIQNAIYQQKIVLEAQKYLRNLRREAFIEIKRGDS